MKIIMIWETEADVKTKNYDYHRKMKPVKLNGRKPNKIVMHHTDNRPENQRQIKRLVTFDGLVITNTGVPVYDGRKKSA